MTAARRRPPLPLALHFLVSLCIAAAFYAQRILVRWAERAESDLIVLCLAREGSEAAVADLLAGLKEKGLLRGGRVVAPGEVATWVTEAAGSAPTPTTSTAMAAAATSGPAAIELTFRDAVRAPDRFAEAIEMLQKHPVPGALFYDAAAQQRAARFFERARGALRVYLILVLVGAFAAVAGSARRAAEREASGGLSPSPLAAEPGRPTRHGAGAWFRGPAASVALVATGWFCLFAIQLAWPLPALEGLSTAVHARVLVTTVVVGELVIWCAAAVGRFFRGAS